jgi:hypothetical protein
LGVESPTAPLQHLLQQGKQRTHPAKQGQQQAHEIFAQQLLQDIFAQQPRQDIFAQHREHDIRKAAQLKIFFSLKPDAMNFY